MRFAVVQDIAASWEDYHRLRRTLDRTPVPGLILHAAGPTDEGFRTIDVWESESAWRRLQERYEEALGELARPPVVRELDVEHVVYPPAPAGREEESACTPD